MKGLSRLARSAAVFATAIVVSTVGLVVIAQPAQAYCTISRWRYSSYTLNVRSNIPSSWQTSIQGAMHQWNGIPGSNLALWGPVFNSNVANPEFVLYLADFQAWGLADNPGQTLGPANSGTHSSAEVLLNSRFNWNTSGTMNHSTRQTDVRTVAVHEMGHANGLHHPDVCGPPLTTDEQNSVMYVNWTTKQYTNVDNKAGIAVLY